MNRMNSTTKRQRASLPTMIALAAAAALSLAGCAADTSTEMGEDEATGSVSDAYKTEGDCESFEGAGQCGYCPLGAGDAGWHRKAACATIAVGVAGPRRAPRVGRK